MYGVLSESLSLFFCPKVMLRANLRLFRKVAYFIILQMKEHLIKKEENEEYSSLIQKESCRRFSYVTSSFWRMVLARSTVIEGSSMEDCLLSKGIPHVFGKMHNWMGKIALYNPKNLVNSVEIEGRRTIDCYDYYHLKSSGSGCQVSDKSSSFDSLTTGVAARKPEIVEPLDLSSKTTAIFDLKPSTVTCSENYAVLPIEVTDGKISTSRPDADSQHNKLASHIYEINVKKSREGNYEHQKNHGTTSVKADSFEAATDVLGKRIPQYALAKQEHAFAGAMAGIFVSLCLHPVDTVKTVIQSCHTSQKPLYYILRSIIAERGVSGLYRGFSSNIVSSAPSIHSRTNQCRKVCFSSSQGILLISLLHSEGLCKYCYVIHFYSKTALVQVIQKGGLPSLYAGWGAVLHRNVPHSIIKFYTYESLKQIMLPSIHGNPQLVCGGLAGSTASLFTTPFDVVKTRLLTQIPGSMTKQIGVLSILKEIRKHEGLAEWCL